MVGSWQWNAYQLRAFAATAACDVLVQAGGRGSSKSTTSFGLLLRTAQEYVGSRSLLIRTTDKALRAPWLGFKAFLTRLGVAYTANEDDGEVRIGASTVVFGVCETPAYWERTWRGHEYATVVVQEAASFADPDVWLLFLSNLRVPAETGWRPLFVVESNPGPGGWWLDRTFLEPARALPAGAPFPCAEMGGLTVVVLRSTLEDNPAISATHYDASLRAAAAGSEVAYERERRGNFGLISGALFPLRTCHAVAWPAPSDWRHYAHIKLVAGGDHGSRSPFCIHVAAQFAADGLGPDGQWYAKGSYVFIAEATSGDRDTNYTRAAYEASIQDVARAYYEECERVHIAEPPRVHMDSQISQQHGADTLLNEYRRYMRVAPVRKGRVIDGIRRIRELMAAAAPVTAAEQPARALLAPLGASGAPAAAPRETLRLLPALYVDPRRCPALYFALQNVTANPKDPETIDPNSRLDHYIDAARYLLESSGAAITPGHAAPGLTVLPPSRDPLFHASAYAPPWLRAGPQGVATADAMRAANRDKAARQRGAQLRALRFERT